MTYAFEYFKRFERKEFLTRNELEYAVDHICLNLNNPPRFGYKYFYNMYSYITKFFIVCNWKEQNGYKKILSKFGEAICNDQFANFFEDQEDKKCSCLSVYYKI